MLTADNTDHNTMLTADNTDHNTMLIASNTDHNTMLTANNTDHNTMLIADNTDHSTEPQVTGACGFTFKNLWRPYASKTKEKENKTYRIPMSTR